jgi:hypothetical protein
MSDREKKTAAEISRMVQDEIDPMGERGTVRVGPPPAPGAGWFVTTTGTARADYIAAAQRKADELSNLYEMIEESSAD